MISNLKTYYFFLKYDKKRSSPNKLSQKFLIELIQGHLKSKIEKWQNMAN